jgi:hypothetical protein
MDLPTQAEVAMRKAARWVKEEDRVAAKLKALGLDKPCQIWTKTYVVRIAGPAKRLLKEGTSVQSLFAPEPEPEGGEDAPDSADSGMSFLS